ncbi:hypothetical protein SPSIL_053940 [Sporomusa silvacetica DSM 10669]|uniref:HEPN domain-containing protein n=1 Tax=Sporomusa silvacetica DSM 10669 TaxID=1123289 RepID=A0ABZ3IUR9_9FIRM|nr:HEPN domain-containing protein [Sporomusa silvacetica]OZC19516.1 HEPN domain protein [Sporomusa silvacetica DSM 10669]
MQAKELMELANYRMEKAQECYRDAEAAFGEERLAASVNRSYYAIFHMTRALLALDGLDFKKHSSIIGHFNQYYIATSKIKQEYYKILAKAFQVRNQSDYNDFYVVSREDAKQQMDNARIFIAEIKGYLEQCKQG